MKKALKAIGTALIALVCIPVVLVVGIVLLISRPFEKRRYHRTPYYKDTKKEYRLLITSDSTVKLYNRMVLENLPIRYFENDGTEYFIQNGVVLLCGYCHEEFKEENGEWIFIFDHEEMSCEPMQKIMDEERERLRLEHRGLPVKFLMLYDDITDAEIFETAKECPHFHCVVSTEEI